MSDLKNVAIEVKPLVTEGENAKDDDQQAGTEENKPPSSVGKKSNWLSKIRKEQLGRESRMAAEKEERARRLKALLDSDDEDNNERSFNYKEMVGDNLTDFLSKIENHVRAE